MDGNNILVCVNRSRVSTAGEATVPLYSALTSDSLCLDYCIWIWVLYLRKILISCKEFSGGHQAGHRAGALGL